MSNDMRNLWVEVGNKCLQRASELLDDKSTPAAATAETVKSLVDTAIQMTIVDQGLFEKSRPLYPNFPPRS